MSFSNLFALVTVAFGTCPVANPDTSTMTTAFKSNYDTVTQAGTLDTLSGGALHFKNYVENCVDHDATATSSNEISSFQFAPQIGGTTLFYNNKSSHLGLNIYGGDLLVIPSNYFSVINDAKDKLEDADFNILISALVESGLYKAISDGDNGKNNWPSVNSVLTDSDDSDHDVDHLFFCVHLDGHISVNWMHMHIFQSAEWRSNDDLWNPHNTCAKLQKPEGGWEGLLDDQTAFNTAVQQLATCLEANYGDGNAGIVADFDTCGANNVSSSDSTTQSPASSTFSSTATSTASSTSSSTASSTDSSTASTEAPVHV